MTSSVPGRWKDSVKLSNTDIIQLFQDGVYKLDLETGQITGQRGHPLAIKLGGKTENYSKVRLFHKGKCRELPLAHVVWMVGAKRTIPPGFEIHHKDTNNQNNSWRNLICLFELDHRKVHNGYTKPATTPDDDF